MSACGLPAAARGHVERLRLSPLPREGGLFRQTGVDGFSSSIFYLLASPDFSALHSLDASEVYHWYDGCPLALVFFDAGLACSTRGVNRVLLCARPPRPDRVRTVLADVGLAGDDGFADDGSAECGVEEGFAEVYPGGWRFVGPQFRVPAGVWQGSFALGDWVLAGTTMSPAFTWEGFTLGDRGVLQREYPRERCLVEFLTRS